MDRKKTLFERASALIVAVAMLASMIPTQVFAQGDVENKSAATSAAAEPESTPAVQKDAVADKQDNTSGAQQGSTSGAQQGDTSGAQQGDTSGAQQGSTSGAQQGDTSGAQQGDTSGAQQGDTSGAQQGDTSGAQQGGETAPKNVLVTGVKLDSEKLDLKAGESASLKATVEPQDAADPVAWTSTDSNIATVQVDQNDDETATVTAVGAGSTVITATCGGQTATCTVTVKASATAVEIQSDAIADGSTVFAVDHPEGIQLTAKTEPEAEFCTDTVIWSLENATAAVIDENTGSLTFLELTQDSETFTVKATAGNASAAWTLTIAKKEDTVTIQDETFVYGEPIQLTAAADSETSIRYALDTQTGNTAGAVVNADGTVTVTAAGTFTVIASSTGNGFYKSGTASKVITVSPKEVAVEYKQPDGIAKTSDGTTALDNAGQTTNAEALKAAFALADGQLVAGDAVKLTVNVDNAVFASTAVGGNTIDLSAVTFALVGTDAANYTLKTTTGTGSCPAKINPVAPAAGTETVAAGKEAQTVGDTGHSVTFQAGTAGSNQGDSKYWYGANGVPVTLDSGVSLPAVGENGAAGEDCLRTEQSGSYFAAASGTSFYICSSETYYGPYTLTYDQDVTGPVIELKKVEATKADDTSEVDDGNGIIFGKAATYTVTVSDTESGVDTDEVYYAIADSQPALDAAGAWTPVTVTPDQENTYTFTVQAPASGNLYVKAADQVANVSAQTFRALVLEENAPQLTVTLDGTQLLDQGATQAYSNNYSLTIKAEEPTGGDRQSGIQKLTYTIATEAGEPLIQEAILKENEVPQQMEDIAGCLDCEVEKTFTELAATGDLNGKYTLTLTATDFCGNQSTFQYTFAMDTTAPAIQVSMTGGVAYQEEGPTYYYKADNCGITVNFVDEHLDAAQCKVTVTGSAGSKEMALAAGETAVTFSAADVAALGDGTVTIQATAADTAGNSQSNLAQESTGVAVSGEKATFVLDTQAPVLKAVNAAGGNYLEQDQAVYFKTDFSLNFTVEDANFDAALVINQTQRTNEGPDAQLAVQDDGAVTLSVSGSAENAVYTMAFTAKDKAGNLMVGDANLPAAGQQAVTVENGVAAMVNRFVLDTLAPELVMVTGTGGNNYSEGVYYTGDFTITFGIREANYNDPADNSAVTVTTEGGNAGTWTVENGTQDDLYTKTVNVTRADTAKTQYKISLTNQDKAGNSLAVAEECTKDGPNQVTLADNAATVKTRIMDNVAPEAELFYKDLDEGHYYTEGNQSDIATAYYNDTFEVSVSVTDEGSLDENKLFYTRTWEGEMDAQGTLGTGMEPENTGKTFTGGQVPALLITADKENHTTDGTYVYGLYGTDKAGNPLTVTEKNYSGKDTTRTEKDCGTVETVYTGAPKALDTVAPTATIDYTNLEATHYYADGDTQVNAYYNHDFTASFTFADGYGTAGKSYGIDATKMHYTQNLTDGKDLILGDTKDQVSMAASYTVTGQADNAHYTFGAYGEDKAGNPLDVTEKRIDGEGNSHSYPAAKAEDCHLYYHKVLDTVAPTFSLTVNDPANDLSIAVDAQNRAYYNGDITAAFTVNDSNLDPQKVKMATASRMGTDFNYDTEDVAWGAIVLGKTDAVTGDTSLTLSETATRDGIYRFQIEGEDRAGNYLVQSPEEAGKKDFRATLQQGDGQYWTNLKIRDTLAPTLMVELADHELFYKALLGEMTQQNNTYYNLQVNKPYRQSSNATGTLTKTDCSPTSVMYEISSTTASQSEAGSAYSHDNLTLNLNGEQIFTIAKLVIKDRAGNLSSMPKESNKIYLDVAAPNADELVPTVTVVAKQSGEGRSVAGRDLFNSGVNVQATVTDPGEGVRSSGLYHVYYQVLVNDADWTDKVSVSGKGSVVSAGVIGYGTSGKEYESTVPVEEPITSQDVIDFGFDANTFNYNDVKIFVWAEDNSGNMLTQAEAVHYYFGIDITTPTIDVRYDNNDAQNEKYFKDDRTATVTVTERNFDPSQTVITTESHQISNWTYQAGGMDNGDDDKWIATVAYTEDGDYTFDVTTTDLVGHKADGADYGDSVAPREFTIDKTNPIINIHFDNNDVRNGKYYNKTRTATVSIEEHNFSADGVTLSTTANIQEGSVAAPGAGGWSESGDMNTATVPFTQDGNYTMHVEYVDLAGNEAEPQDVDEFVVDTTEPELTFSINGQAFDKATYEPQAYNGEVIPSITYHDINYDAEGTQMSIVGAKNEDSQILNGAPAEDAMGGVYTCENIEQTPENDDVYTCTGKVMDMAGNESTVDFVFSVNRYGSNYLLGDATQQLVDSYYTNQAPTLDVTEVNVNTLKFKEITYALNGNIQTLEPDSDYSVTESGTETSWKQYDYKIFDSNFTQEGVYDITISSEDEAGNLNSNHTERVKEYSKNISFVLDQTAPSITISGVEEDGRYDSDTRSISINYSENFAMDNVTVTNGEKTETYTAEQLEATNGMIEFVVPASNKKQAVTVTAADKAGNTVSTESPYFLLTSNKFVQFVNNTPLLVGSIVVLLLVVAAVVDYLRKGFLYALLHKKAADKQ